MATLTAAVPRQTRTRTTLDAAVVYVGLRLVSAIVLLLAQVRQPRIRGLDHTPYLGMLTHWDALWFQRIALHGYPHHLPHLPTGQVAMNVWAFYPGFPFLTRLVMQVSDLSFPIAATAVNLVAGVVAAVMMAKMLEVRLPHVVAVGVVAVWAALPMSPALQLAYSEALGMALLCLCLLCLQRRRWLPSAVAAVLLGITRPILLPLLPVFAFAVWLRWRSREANPVGRVERWQMFGGLAAAAAAAAALPALAWWWTGDHGAYLQTQAAWNPGHVLTIFPGLPAELGNVLDGHGLPLHRVIALGVLTTTGVLGVAAVGAHRLDPLLKVWCLTYPVYVAATNPLHQSVYRILLLPMFPLVALVCWVAWRRIPDWWRPLCAALVVLGIVGQYVWVAHLVVYRPGSFAP